MSVLLFGKVINLQERLAPDWDTLRRGIAKKYHFTPEKSLSMTLGYEMLENQILKRDSSLNETGIHKEIAAQVETDAMKQKKDWDGTVHAKLAALPVKAILTTNYDYAIERSLDPAFKKNLHHPGDHIQSPQISEGGRQNSLSYSWRVRLSPLHLPGI